MTKTSLKYSAQRGIACLPVTALHVLDTGNVTLLFSNEGSSLTVRHATSGQVVSRRSVFPLQNIHGISTVERTRYDDTVEYHLVVWGGRMVRMGLFTINDSDLRAQSFSVPIRMAQLIAMDDWIMSVELLGSKSKAILLTAHNALWGLDLWPGETNPVSIHQGINTLLYSGLMLVIDDDKILIASGTVFGEVIVWVCSRSSTTEGWNMTTRHMLLGHQGSIFGVAMSDIITFENRQYRLLASCSDDRTIRLWDISDSVEDRIGTNSQTDLSHTTTFGIEHGQTSHLSTTWAHLSRIWCVYFAGKCGGNSENEMYLVSRGEDGVCQSWEISLCELLKSPRTEINAPALKSVGCDRHHAGKNIWSLTTSKSKVQTTVYTGGADGQVISRCLHSYQAIVNASISFRKITDNHGQYLPNGLKQYLALDDGAVIATTGDGNVVRNCDSNFRSWLPIYHSDKNLAITLCSNQVAGFTFYCLSTGEMCMYDTSRHMLQGVACTLSSQVAWMQIIHISKTANDGHRICLVVNLRRNSQPKLITITQKSADFTTQVQDICLPADFAVVTAYWYGDTTTLICGSRAGAIAICSNIAFESAQIKCTSIIRHVHGSDSVTSIVALPKGSSSQSSNLIHIVTTGRDGTFAVHSLHRSDIEVKFRTLHRGIAPLGPDIEGAVILDTGAQDPALVLYGFKSTSFVVWDETHRTELLSVDSGNAHRKWSYCPGHGGQETFVWTQAKMFNYFRKPRRVHHIIQTGGHGREIKASAVSFRNSSHDTVSKLVATGAEDTEIRLFKYANNSISQLAILKHHTTGVQALKFSSCGQYLFSSGGIEEFLVWRLCDIPLLKVGVMMVGNLIKNEEDDDARIMAFDVMNGTPDKPETRSFIILMSYSNGKSKLFEFSIEESSLLGSFTLIQQLHVGNLCLTRAQLIGDDILYLMLVGATDGVLRVADAAISSEGVVSHRVHQSNIAAISTSRIGPQSYMIVTGGDDNALAISFFQTNNRTAHFETAFVPKAHAAAVTGVAIVSTRSLLASDLIYIASVGNDQKVRLWRVSHLVGYQRGLNGLQNVSVPGTWSESVQVEKVCDISIDVADVSNLEVVNYDEIRSEVFKLEVLVVGVGMESIFFEVGH